MSRPMLPSIPEPPLREPEDRKFRPTNVSVICWVVASSAHAWAVAGLSAGQSPAFRLGFVAGSFIGLGLIIGLVAVITRRVFRQSNKTANIVFSIGIFFWAAFGAYNVHHRGPAGASAAEAPPVALSESDVAAMMEMARGSSPAGRRTPTPPQRDAAPVVQTPQQQARAARGVFLARQFPHEQASASRLIAMIHEGKPWQVVDSMVDPQTASPAFRQAYQAWQQAEIRAGNDPKVTSAKLAAITKLYEIRKALARYRERNNNRPPALAVIAALPPNPLTGHKTVVAAGAATKTDGWSYDESTGTIRIVLPTTCAGLTPAEIEWPRTTN